jgi:hypothetical protein
MDKDTHVYCTDCVYGDGLITSIGTDEIMPKACMTCYCLDPEDSCPYYLRQNYVAREVDPEIQVKMPKFSKTWVQMNVFEVVWDGIKRLFNGV